MISGNQVVSLFLVCIDHCKPHPNKIVIQFLFFIYISLNKNNNTKNIMLHCFLLDILIIKEYILTPSLKQHLFNLILLGICGTTKPIRQRRHFSRVVAKKQACQNMSDHTQAKSLLPYLPLKDIHQQTQNQTDHLLSLWRYC